MGLFIGWAAEVFAVDYRVCRRRRLGWAGQKSLTSIRTTTTGPESPASTDTSSKLTGHPLPEFSQF